MLPHGVVRGGFHHHLRTRLNQRRGADHEGHSEFGGEYLPARALAAARDGHHLGLSATAAVKVLEKKPGDDAAAD